MDYQFHVKHVPMRRRFLSLVLLQASTGCLLVVMTSPVVLLTVGGAVGMPTAVTFGLLVAGLGLLVVDRLGVSLSRSQNGIVIRNGTFRKPIRLAQSEVVDLRVEPFRACMFPSVLVDPHKSFRVLVVRTHQSRDVPILASVLLTEAMRESMWAQLARGLASEPGTHNAYVRTGPIP